MAVLAQSVLLVLLTIGYTYGTESGVSKDEFLTLKNLVTQQNDALRKYEEELELQRKVIEKLQKVCSVVTQEGKESFNSASGCDVGVSKEDFLALKNLVILQNDTIRKNEVELALQRKVVEELQNERQTIRFFGAELKNVARHLNHLDNLLRNTMISKVQPNEKRSVTSETVAFHACFDHDVQHLGNSHELAFNSVLTDTHSAYEKYSGTYIVPIPGMYVFSWVTPIYNGDIPFQLIVNGAVKGKTDPSGNAHISSTGVAVLSLNEHDAVMIRTHPNFTPRGILESNTWMNACFSGWKV